DSHPPDSDSHPPDFLLFWQDIQDISGYPATSSWVLEVDYLSASGRCFNAKRVADSASSPRLSPFLGVQSVRRTTKAAL
ncbi:hypothetical protein ACU38C_002489, partial [Vibrio cholerae]